MLKAFVLSTFILATATTCRAAENVWIHVVGIDEISKKQNYPYFYNSAVAFEKACGNVSSKTECHLLINDDPSLHSPEFTEYPTKITSVEGAPTVTNITELFKEKLAKATPGSTVILSLQNHGAPVQGRGASCIWISADQQICNTDIAQLLKLKPPGVKVVINADGCFSGAFAELSSKDVCTVTSADRLFFGTSASRSLWNAISDRHPQKLADLREPIIAESGQQKLLGSQVILQQLCAGARSRTDPKLVISNLTAKKNNVARYEDPTRCRDADLTAKKMAIFSDQVLNIIAKQNADLCPELGAPKIVCDAVQRLKVASPEIRTKLKELFALSAREDSHQAWFTKNETERRKMITALSALQKVLTPAELKELNDSATLGIEPDYRKMMPSHGAAAKKFFNSAKPFLKQMRQAGEETKRSDQIVADLKASGLYEDLLMVQTCFLENRPMTPESIDAELREAFEVFSASAKQFPQKQFTVDDYTEALKCEQSLSL